MRVKANGIGLEVQVSGKGPDVLLVHGYPDTHDLWRHQVKALNAAGYRTIAPDLRGYGASDKPEGTARYGLPEHVGDLLGILDELGVERAHLVGHDWGASVALQLAGSAPGRARSLTVLSVGHYLSIVDAGLPQREKSWYMLLFQFPEIAERWLSADDFANARQLFAGHPDLDEVIGRLRDPGALTAGLGLYRANGGAEPLVDPPREMPPVVAPVMGVWSSEDPYLTERSMTGSEKHLAGTWRYERLDGVGHWMQLEDPARVNRLLLDFLNAAGSGRAANQGG